VDMGEAQLNPVGAQAPRQKSKFHCNYQHFTLCAPPMAKMRHPQQANKQQLEKIQNGAPPTVVL